MWNSLGGYKKSIYTYVININTCIYSYNLTFVSILYNRRILLDLILNWITLYWNGLLKCIYTALCGDYFFKNCSFTLRSFNGNNISHLLSLKKRLDCLLWESFSKRGVSSVGTISITFLNLYWKYFQYTQQYRL